MPELVWYEWVAVLYMSLYIIKMVITIKDMSFLVKAELFYKAVEVPEGMSEKNHYRAKLFFYSLGAGASLTVMLVPVVFMEGLRFFETQPKERLIRYARTGEWS